MNENLFNFNFNGVNIPFEATLGNTRIFVDATEMAKSMSNTKEEYNRIRPYRWLRSQDCKEYLDALKRARNLGTYDLIKQIPVPGKRGSGHIWMDKKLAIRYAQRINPDFAIWVDDRIDEILTSGYSSMTQENGNLQNTINMLTNENNNLKQQLTSQQPAINYYNQVLNQKNGYTTRDICTQLGLRISNKVLIKMLVDRGYMYRDKIGKPYFYEPWNNQGYQTTVYKKCSDGIVRPEIMWKEVGKQIILERALDWKLI